MSSVRIKASGSLHGADVLVDGREVPAITSISVELPLDGPIRAVLGILVAELDMELEDAEIVYRAASVDDAGESVYGEGASRLAALSALVVELAEREGVNLPEIS